ncbi:hypothetical protein N802_02225 [Knoellia sinensis KCTC 19936]|uniref:PknH-like extracellular domain-containing protein n=1 Tax=Knoellia sinensis KCTC 19936 TaxID=1385520 RepID=A0A0A0JG67_9MICO|nr:hypothetical protein [Knoellia sinensis]KGN35052.1 hypothetical protein N802_02225 [Knoellia sinensis KCTC 19936]
MSFDDDLDRLLRRSFDEARPNGSHGVLGLREGAVAQARRIRRRRRVGAALGSTTVVATLVAGASVLGPVGWLGGGADATVGVAAGQPGTAPAPGVTPASPESPYSLSAFVPDPESLPTGLAYTAPVAEDRDARGSVIGQVCDGVRVADTTGMDQAPHAVANAWRMALSPDEVVPRHSVKVTLTGWTRGTGAERFADLQGNRQGCRFNLEYERLTWPGRDTGTTWLVRLGTGDSASRLAAQRVGDVIVAVEVSLREGEAAEQQNAIALSDAIAASLRVSSLPAARGE